MRKATLTATACGAALVCGLGVAATSARAPQPDSEDAIVHVLNRVAFGPAPGDLQHVRGIGISRYIDEQLHPEHVADSGMDARLAGLETIRLSSREIAEQFGIPEMKARLAKQRAAAGNSPDSAAGAEQAPKTDETARRANQVIVELSAQKLLRAAYSERQLQEVLVDFWFNHFNVDARKGADRFLVTEYEREVIRPRVLGRFRDLLGATAKSPAMLFYLDNWMSADPDAAPPPRQRAPKKNAPRGLNENYARELMELHTLGVDGGYTQKDVTEIARALTGWTIQNPRLGGGYRFEARLHDRGEKIVLGHVIKAGGGEGDGEEVLDILARHPATARFIATALVRRLVNDTPPPALVNRAAARFTKTDGDLREVTRLILTSPEFLSADAYAAKTKTPLDFVVSVIRTTGVRVEDPRPLVRAMRDLGMPLYFCQPPTGYRDTADAWINTGALVSRMNFAIDLAAGKYGSIASEDHNALALHLGSPEFQRR